MNKTIIIQGLVFPSRFKSEKQVWREFYQIRDLTPHLGVKEILKIVKADPIGETNQKYNPKKTKTKNFKKFKTQKMSYLLNGQGYNEYILSKEWKEVRNTIISERKCCELSGSTKNLQVHHINYKVLGHENRPQIQKDWLLLVSKNVHDLIHENIMFVTIDPKRTKEPISRLRFLEQFKKSKDILF